MNSCTDHLSSWAFLVIADGEANPFHLRSFYFTSVLLYSKGLGHLARLWLRHSAFSTCTGPRCWFTECIQAYRCSPSCQCSPAQHSAPQLMSALPSSLQCSPAQASASSAHISAPQPIPVLPSSSQCSSAHISAPQLTPLLTGAPCKLTGE